MSIITIGRQYGSGGKAIGNMIADKLGIPLYDKELIYMAAEKAEIHASTVAQLEEQSPVQNIIGSGMYSGYDMPMSDKIYIAQCGIIKEIACKGDCVIVGRGADYVLRDSFDVISVFIHADMKDRIERVSKIESDIPIEKMESHIVKIDKSRKKYYEFYTEQTWGALATYDICISSSKFGLEGSAGLIINAYNCNK